MIAQILLLSAAGYLLFGLAFAVPFVLVGVGKIDPHAVHGSWGFRVLIIPGSIFLWPLLARRWMKGAHEPPEENNSHRRAARDDGSGRREEALIEIRISKSEARKSQSLSTSAAANEGNESRT